MDFSGLSVIVLFFGIGRDLFPEKEGTIRPAIYINNTILSTTFRTEPVSKFNAETFANMMVALVTTYHFAKRLKKVKDYKYITS